MITYIEACRCVSLQYHNICTAVHVFIFNLHTFVYIKNNFFFTLFAGYVFGSWSRLQTKLQFSAI